MIITFVGQAAEGWLIEPVALPGDVIDNKMIVNVLKWVDIDESGNVAFIADYTDAIHTDPTVPGRGIFTQYRVVAVVGDVIDGDTIVDISDFRSTPSIANNIVSYIANIPPNFTIFGAFKEQSSLFTAGDLLDISGDIASRPFCCPLSINNAGTVAINTGASNNNPPSSWVTNEAVYTIPGGLVVRRGEVIDGHELTSTRTPKISDLGDIATKVSIVTTSTLTSSAVMINRTFAMLPGDEIGITGQFFARATNVAINNSANVAVNGATTTAAAIMTLDRVVAKAGGIVDGRKFRAFADIEINNANDVAFLAGYGNGTWPFTGSVAVFMGDDLAADTGDISTGGYELTNIDFQGGIGFNDAKEVAFAASYTTIDGESGDGVFVATFAGAFNITSLSEQLDVLLGSGEIDSKMGTSLEKIMSTVASAVNRDKVCVAINTLKALKNHIESQRGKKITDNAASDLIIYINNFITQLESELTSSC